MKTEQVFWRTLSTALVNVLLKAIQVKRAFVCHAMKIVKPAPGLIARIVWPARKERRKTKEVHKKIQNIVLASAPQDFIHIKRVFAYHAIKIVRLAREQIVSIAWLAPKERRRTKEVLWRILNTVFKPVPKGPPKLVKMFANQAQTVFIFLLSLSFLISECLSLFRYFGELQISLDEVTGRE